MSHDGWAAEFEGMSADNPVAALFLSAALDAFGPLPFNLYLLAVSILLGGAAGSVLFDITVAAWTAPS